MRKELKKRKSKRLNKNKKRAAKKRKRKKNPSEGIPNSKKDSSEIEILILKFFPLSYFSKSIVLTI